MKNSRSVFVFLLCVVNWVSCNFGAEVQQIGLSNTSTVETSSRIIGGTETTIETYPFAVQINRGNSLVCGGSLLTRQIVLSAAHCFFDEDGVLIDIFHFRVRAGTTNNNSGGTVVRISRLIIHEKYNIPLRDNDIALLQMRFPLTLSDSIGLVEIPKQNFVLDDNTELKQIGWGSTMEDELRMSPVLMEVTVRKINHELCRQRYQLLANGTSLFLVTDSMLCAGLLGVGGKHFPRRRRGLSTFTKIGSISFL
ncbi:achelase-1-like [Hyposmocoma kahamanoa]|uniref:achelase-1-like n=1 Tax=Hyposmocoma kahamanoa TaxID=1477025 RepID=UPI000E6D6183|nr:achelase-1-like [Hyposmocoma kahamanoa]